VVFISIALLILITDIRFDYLGKLRFALGYVTAPVYWVADVPARTSAWIDDVLVSHTDLIEENERLREQLLVSQRELQLMESLVSENNRLLDLNESSRVIAGEVMPAEIINTSPDPYSKRVLINKGANQGVYVGQAVLDANGLMGQVMEVLPFTSWVLLITDSHHVTPVQVNRNGERALARGSRTTSAELELEFVTQTQDMLPGDLLVSSGMGQIYPKNYPVAEITSVRTDPGQPFAVIKAQPLAQIASTRHIMLVFENQVAVPPVDVPLLPIPVEVSDQLLEQADSEATEAQTRVESAAASTDQQV